MSVKINSLLSRSFIAMQNDLPRKLAQCSKPVRSETKIYHDSDLALGSLDCSRPMWLARVITLVLLKRHRGAIVISIPLEEKMFIIDIPWKS